MPSHESSIFFTKRSYNSCESYIIFRDRCGSQKERFVVCSRKFSNTSHKKTYSIRECQLYFCVKVHNACEEQCWKLKPKSAFREISPRYHEKLPECCQTYRTTHFFFAKFIRKATQDHKIGLDNPRAPYTVLRLCQSSEKAVLPSRNKEIIQKTWITLSATGKELI